MSDSVSTDRRRVAVLGPCRVGDEALSAGQRALLAALAFHRDAGASTAQLIDAVWPGDAPRSARPSVQNQIARLRRRFGDDLVLTRGSWYHLQRTTDVDAFEELVIGAIARPPGPAACGLLEAALQWWGGVPYDDLLEHPPVEAERARLLELHAVARERLGLCRIAGGDPRQAIVDLIALTEDEPFRERAWELLMIALHLDGRATEALAAYERAATRFARELGGARMSQQLQLVRAAIAAGKPAPFERLARPAPQQPSTCMPRATSRHRRCAAHC